MTRRTPLLTLLVLLVGAVIVPGTFASARASSSASSGDQGRPPVGKCYRLSLKQTAQASSSAKAVPCRSRHTTVTVAVSDLPDGVGYKSSKDKLIPAVDKICDTAVAKTAAGNFTTFAQTLYNYVNFFPTAAQQKAGARWVRCDVALYSDEFSKVESLPSNTRPLIKHGIERSMRRCADKAERKTYLACTQPHAYRSVGAFFVDGPYQSDTEFRAVVVARCPAYTKRSPGFGNRQNEADWDAGDHAIVCFAKTTH